MRLLAAILCTLVSAPVFGMAEAGTESVDVAVLAWVVVATSGSYGIALALSPQRIARFVMAPAMLGVAALTCVMPVAGVTLAMAAVLGVMLVAAFS